MYAVKADFVTETDDYIIIENSYYIANFTKGWHGRVQYFYVKPQVEVNIVCKNTFTFLGGHEVVCRNGTACTSSSDWGLEGSKDSQETQVVYETNQICVVESITQFTATFPHVKMKVIEYYIFYQNKPYYLVSAKRIYQQDIPWHQNAEYCFLLDKNWADLYYRLDYSGEIREGTTGGDHVQMKHTESWVFESYPWAMFYNSTYGKGFFTILLSGHPKVTLGLVSQSATYEYREYQIGWHLNGVKDGDVTWAVFLNGVAANATYPHDLARSLWTDTCREKTSFINRVSCTETINLQILNGLGLATEAGSSSVKIGITAEDQIFTQLYFQPELSVEYMNATDEYSIFEKTGMSVTVEKIEEENYEGGNVTWTNTFENKLKYTVATQYWNDSDVCLQTWTFKTLTAMNITWIRLDITAYGTHISFSELSNDVIKWNASDYYASSIMDEGMIFKNLTDTPKDIYLRVGGRYYGRFYAVNGTEQEYGANQEFTMKFRLQFFRRFKAENLAYFGLNDILNVHESKMIRHYSKPCWNSIPLFDAESPFRVNHLGRGSLIFDAERTTGMLKFKIIAPSGNTTTTKIYCGSKGEPIKVVGANSWSYDAVTKILTILITHSSAQNVEVYWPILGDVNCDGSVDTLDLHVLSKAYDATPSSPNWNPNYDLNCDNIINSLDLSILSENYGKTLN